LSTKIVESATIIIVDIQFV